MSLIAELKRRNVFRVLAAYVVLSWLSLQIGDVLFDALGVPAWGIRLVVGLLVIGVIPAVVFSWAYELTPEGIKKESEIDRSKSITSETGRKLDYITIGMIVLGIGFVVVDRLFLFEPDDASVPTAVTDAGQAARERDVPEAATRAAKSIAVLPFADMSPEGDQEYFSDGIAEEILNALVQIDGLAVASRTSSFAYKGRKQNIAEIASALKVDHVLEGSVRKAGNRVRITAQLIDAGNDRHLWSDTFDRELTDIFAIQDEIASSIVSALTGTLGEGGGKPRGLVTADTENLNAYDLFLKGREMFLARDRLDQAVEILEETVELDPGFARAWETLAAVYTVSPSWGIGSEEEYGPLSDKAADEALRLDPDRHFSHAIKAQNLSKQFPVDFEQVLSLNQRAIDGNPKNPTPILWRAISYRFLGYAERAREDLDRCLDLDPAYENCRNHLAFFAFETDPVEDALAWLDRNLTEVSVRHEVLFGYFVPEMVRRGEFRLAYMLADAPAWNFDGDSRPINLWISALQHPEENHQERLRKLEQWAEAHQREIHPLVYAGMGAYDRMTPSFSTRQILWRSDLTALRASSHFKRLVRDTGIQAYWEKHGLPPRCRAVGDDDFECD